MDIEGCTDNCYFEVENAIKGIPLSTNGNRLKLGMFEVGYKSKGKRKQLKWKTLEIIQKNLKHYATELDIFRGIVHYQPERKVILDLEGYEIDFIISYNCMSERMLELFDRNDIKWLMTYVRDKKPMKSRIRKYLLDRNPEGLAEIINNSNGVKYAAFKGALAEMMAIKDIEKENPTGINFFPHMKFYYEFNGDMRDTEVDGFFTFYETERFAQLFRNLDNYGSIDLKVSKRLKV